MTDGEETYDDIQARPFIKRRTKLECREALSQKFSRIRRSDWAGIPCLKALCLRIRTLLVLADERKSLNRSPQIEEGRGVSGVGSPDPISPASVLEKVAKCDRYLEFRRTGQLVLAIAPGNLLDHDATISAVGTSYTVQRENQKTPQGNELEAALREMIVPRR